MDGAVAFGVVGGSATRPEVSYLDTPIQVSGELLALTHPVEPTEVFRFAAPCAEGGCRHFDGAECRLGHKLARDVPEATRLLRPCRLRPNCRWWHEQGAAACRRCPAIVTTDYGAGEELRRAADPAES
jgi:hypothetical protein